MVSDEGMFFSFVSFHLILFPLPPMLVIQLVEVLLTKVCECVSTVAVEMSSSIQYACVSGRIYVLLSSLPFFPFWLSFTSLPAFASASHDHQFVDPLCVLPFLCLTGKKRQGQIQMAEYGCWWRLNVTVYTSQLPLRSRLNSVKPLCLHAPFHCNLNVLNTVAW